MKRVLSTMWSFIIVVTVFLLSFPCLVNHFYVIKYWEKKHGLSVQKTKVHSNINQLRVEKERPQISFKFIFEYLYFFFFFRHCFEFSLPSSSSQHAYALELLHDQLHEGAKALDVGSGSGILSVCFARMVSSAVVQHVSFGCGRFFGAFFTHCCTRYR